MTRKLLVRQGGGGASEVDFLDLATPRKGAPFFDRDTPLFQVGQRFANGEAAMGYFKIVDPAAALSTTGFRTRPWCEVRLTEDASGDELTLGWMRITANDASRRAPYTGGDQVEHDPQLMDCNMDLRGIPFEAGWHRDAENEGERLNALEGVKLNGASSTGDIHRVTTNITVAAIADGHLCDMSAGFDLETVNYPAGTEVAEIIADIAEQSGKTFGVVLHHTGGSTHKCLLYVDQEDLTTYTTDVRISDQLADHDPDDPTAPTFAPHWLMGAGREQNMEGVISGLVSIYGGIDGEERTVFVETGEDDDDWETWVGVFNDDQADTLTVAERHANWQLADRKRPYQTHKVSILVSAEQAHLVEAGMAIETKSVVMEPGPNKHNWIWRRVAEKTIEPVADGRYWLHLHLERPRHTHGNPGGGGQPGSTSPKPAPECVEAEPDTESVLSDTSVGDWGSTVTTGSCWGGDPHRLIGGSGQLSPSVAVSAGDVIRGSVNFRDETGNDPWENVTNYNYHAALQFFGTALPMLEYTIINERFHLAGCINVNRSTTQTVPAGYTSARVKLFSRLGGYQFNGTISEVTFAVPPDNDPDCLPAPTGTSPYYARSDDPRFDNDDQHLTTQLRERVTNNSGALLNAGDIVIPDITQDDPSVTTTTTAAQTANRVGIVEADFDDGEVGVVIWEGAITDLVINDGASTSADGDYLFTSTTAGAASVNAARSPGAVGRIIRDDSGDPAYVIWWGVPDSASGGSGDVATDNIWDAKGDLAAGTGSNTADNLTVGANDTILMADSAQTTGLKWVASATPSNQAFGDSAATGTADTFTRGDHKHGMPADPTTALTGLDFLVGTATGALSGEIVAGTTPGGELGGTWASPTVDSTHSGSAHHAESHNTRHESGGADSIPLDTLAAPTDITTLNASTSAHGLLRKLDNSGSHYLDGQGNWTSPSAAAGAVDTSSTYTPALTAVTTNPTIGSTGTITGRYAQLGADKLFVECYVEFLGTGITVGNGNYRLSLPGSFTGGAVPSILCAYYLDSGTAHRLGSAMVAAGATLIDLFHASSGANAGITNQANPQTWAAGDRIIVTGTIQL